MIAAVLIGKEHSTGFPGKNLFPVLGRPLMAYPLRAATRAASVDAVYVSTDSERIEAVARQYGAQVINRPAELCTKDALSEDVFIHARDWIAARLPQGHEIELMVLLMCNAPMITAEIIDEGVRVLRADPRLNSAVSVSCYNMWGPHRARRIGSDGLLHPFVPHEVLPRGRSVTSNRDSDEDAWFADMGVSIIRPRCLETIADGQPPQRWMGQRIYPLRQEGGLDVDVRSQVAYVEHWLKERGLDQD